MTPLDQALKRADENNEKAREFYQVFLATHLVIPVKATDERLSGLKKVEKSDHFYPLFVRHDSERVIPAFDSLDRLRHWSDGGTFDYIEVTGGELIGILDEEILVAINLGTAFSHIFSAAELEELRHLPTESEENDRETAIVVRKLDPVPPELERFLEAELKQHPSVQAAWVAELFAPSHNQSRLTVLLELGDKDAEAATQIQTEISLAARKILGAKARFFLMIADGGQIARAIQEHEAVYHRDKVWN